MKRASKKRLTDESIYNTIRKRFLSMPQNQVCFIGGCGKRATTIEHTMGRVGYADDWARDNGITLFLDVRFWRGCCHKHNLELERNPELSKKYQLSKIHHGQKLEK